MFSQYLLKKVLFIKLLIAILAVGFFAYSLFVQFSYAEGESTSSTTPEAVIETGDAVAIGDVENTANTNVLDTNNASTTPVVEPEEEPEPEINTESEGGEEENNTASSTPTNIEVSNENDADIENEVVVEATTGDNEAEGSGDSYIETGDAVASADVVNLANTNIYNSNGLFLFLNSLFGQVGEIDIRNFGIFNEDEGGTEANGCSSGCDAQGSLDINNDNDASITNDITVTADTGGNTAGGGGNGVISTGNAYASANVVNVANTNIVDSNYLVLTFNNFGDWAGDLVFPAGSFFENVFGQGGSVGSGSTSVSNDNTANVENNVSTEADTGDNEASGNGLSVVQTGSAGSSVNVVNQVNTNIFNQDSFAVMLNIHGNWGGDVFSAPDNIGWTSNGGGLQFFHTGNQNGTSPSLLNGETDITNTNQAYIENNVNVFALTGENKIDDTDSTSYVSTGDAYASTNIVNVANTNILGRNWILAIVNIFGDWTGDVAFGRPDLWVGEIAKLSRSPLEIGETAKYTFTVINNGDAPATHVRVIDRFDTNEFDFGKSYSEYFKSFDNSTGEVVWEIDSIDPGESVEVSYESVIQYHISYGLRDVSNYVRVESFETDQDYGDNSDTASVPVYGRKVPLVSHDGIIYDEPPRIDMKKINNATGLLTAGTPVDYKIVLENGGGGTAFDAVLVDTLVNEKGEVIYEEAWALGDVRRGEEITVSYQILFNASTTPGVYTNYAQVFSGQYHPDPELGLLYESRIAKSSVSFFERKGDSSEGGFIENIEVPTPEEDLKILRDELKPVRDDIVRLQKDILSLGKKVEDVRLAVLDLVNSNNSHIAEIPTPPTVEPFLYEEEEEFVVDNQSLPLETLMPVNTSYAIGGFNMSQIAGVGMIDRDFLPEGAAENALFFVLFFLIRLKRKGLIL